jgi:hypothetical protein
MKKLKSLYHGHRSRRASSAALFDGIDMTLRVNREIGFEVASAHEFPEGGAAVSLDGGSH